MGMCVSPACLLPGPASFHHGLTLTSGSTNYSAQIKEQYSILHRAITSTTVNSHSPNRPPSQIKRPALPILVTQALNQTLGRQCSCVGHVWSDPWARFIPVGKATPAHSAPARWASPIVWSPLQHVHPPRGSSIKCSCTVGRGRFP